jgi:La domain
MIDTENQPAVANGAGGDAVASLLEKKIIRQIEYYFGDYNLPKDKFLQVTVQCRYIMVPAFTRNFFS